MKKAKRYSFSIFQFLGAILVLAYGSYLFSFWYNNVRSVSWAHASKIDEGMTKIEVLAIMGEPHRQYSSTEWAYRVRGAMDLYLIDFNSSEEVISVTF